MRIAGWETRLRAAVARHRALPFGWGTSDCFVFPMDCVEAVTGRDPWAAVRGYDNEQAAARLLVAHGLRDVADAFRAVLPEIHPADAGRGDLVVAHAGPGTELGGAVCLGPVVAAKGRDGLSLLPRTAVVRAFRVG